MEKVIGALVTILLCTSIVTGFDRRLQNANLDFIDFESNNVKTTPKPSSSPQGNQNAGPKATPALPPNQNTGAKITPSTPKGLTPTIRPGTTSDPKHGLVEPNLGGNRSPTPTSNVRQIIKNFNDRASDNERQGPTGSTASTQGVRNIGPSISNNPKNVPAAVVAPTTAKSVAKDSFPALPSTGVTGSTTKQPQLSWAGVVSGNKGPTSTPGGTNRPAPTAAKPSSPVPQPLPGFPPLPPPGSDTRNGPEIATDKELKDTSEAIFKKENSNIVRHFTVNYQGKTSSFSKDDLAPQPLITLKPEIWNEPIISAMKALLDNYEKDTTVNEYVTPQEKNEENTFLDLVMASSVMRQLMIFLKEKGVVTPDPKQQRDLVKQIWFNMYSRGQGRIGSSGFEHIFLSEIKNNEVSGLHNWLYFSTEEASNRANYLGYLKKLDLGEKSAILKSHFTLDDIDKPVNTMFIGTSPELEMALYTLCFVTRADRTCPLSLAGKEFTLRTHNFRYRSKNMIGSAFPEI